MCVCARKQVNQVNNTTCFEIEFEIIFYFCHSKSFIKSSFVVLFILLPGAGNEEKNRKKIEKTSV